MKPLNVLIACEESGRVRDEFRKLGHNAWSCDLQPCDPNGLFPQYHYQDSIFHVLHDCRVRGFKWDLMIAHPPCTYLANSGVSWLFKGAVNKATVEVVRATRYRVATTQGYHYVDGHVARWASRDRVIKMRQGAKFFRDLWELDDEIPFIAIENPIMHCYAKDETKCGDPSQIIQPWMFGHPESKATCLWLKGLPKLKETDNVKHIYKNLPKAQRLRLHYLPPGPERAKLRSKTFHGIAVAMADQWSKYILEKYEAERNKRTSVCA